MHSTATKEAVLVRTVLQLVSSVQTAHGSSITEDYFRPSHHLLDIADMTNCIFKRNINAVHLQQTTSLAKRFWLVIMAASCRAVLYFHGSRWATSICFRFYMILDGRLKEISWVPIIFYMWQQRVWFSWKSTVHSISRRRRYMKYDWLGLGRIWLSAAAA